MLTVTEVYASDEHTKNSNIHFRKSCILGSGVGSIEAREAVCLIHPNHYKL